MLILQFVALGFSLGVITLLWRIEAALYSIELWIKHVNGQLTRIEYSQPDEKTPEVAGGRR